MTDKTAGWGELFSGENGLRIAVLMSGVGIHAINVFISGTLLPSVVKDIGGLDLFAWSTTLFIIASIVASIFAAIRPFGLGPRNNYLIAALTFGIGSLLCGMAPNMGVMLLGRAVQGFGAGLLGALTYGMIRLVFAERLWPRAMGLLSGVWGVSTLVGPAIGGVFAQYDAWRWAFLVLVLVPFAAVLGLLALRVIPKKGVESGVTNLPVLQIVLLIGAIVAISVASVVTSNLPLAVGLLLAAVLAIVWLGHAERTSSRRLLPSGVFSAGSLLAPLFVMLLLMQLAITSDIFVPLFLQTLHGQPPLAAGYLVALMAMGWSTGSVLFSGAGETRAKLLLVAGPVSLTIGAVALAFFIARVNNPGELLVVAPIGISLFLMGLGIGSAWPHLLSRMLRAAPAGEGDITSAAINMAQLFASGLGAAAGGVIVNLAGITSAADAPAALPAAWWLFGLFAIVPALAIPAAIAVSRSHGAEAEPQAAE